MESNTNWFNELKKIDEEEKIIGIATDEGFFNTIDEAKEVLDYDFDGGYGGTNGPAFTAWTYTRVHFPVGYDGSEWIDNVPRNPTDEPTGHVGG